MRDCGKILSLKCARIYMYNIYVYMHYREREVKKEMEESWLRLVLFPKPANGQPECVFARSLGSFQWILIFTVPADGPRWSEDTHREGKTICLSHTCG